MDRIKVISPDEKHTAILVFENEIRFGPAYYRLILDTLAVPDRIFGGKLVFSGNRNLVAAEEWLTVDYNTGPVTRGVLFDLDRRTYSPLSVIEKGFVEELRFVDDVFAYQKHYPAHGTKISVEVRMSEITGWQAIW